MVDFCLTPIAYVPAYVQSSINCRHRYTCRLMRHPYYYSVSTQLHTTPKNLGPGGQKHDSQASSNLTVQTLAAHVPCESCSQSVT
jgi:hypothetical protein